MKETNISNLKAHLSEYLGMVRDGEEILVMERQTPVAKICRVSTGDSVEIPQLMRELEQSGVIELNKKKLPKNFFDNMPSSEKSVVEALLEERLETI